MEKKLQFCGGLVVRYPRASQVTMQYFFGTERAISILKRR